MTIAQGLMVAGTAITVQGQLAAGKAAKATADYNASLQDRNAKAQERKAEQIQRIFAFKAQEQEEDFKKLNDRTQMAYRGSGWLATTGTPLKRALTNYIKFKQDLNNQEYNTNVAALDRREAATNARLRGELIRMEGRARAKASRYQAAGTLLSGAAQTAMMG